MGANFPYLLNVCPVLVFTAS